MKTLKIEFSLYESELRQANVDGYEAGVQRFTKLAESLITTFQKNKDVTVNFPNENPDVQYGLERLLHLLRGLDEGDWDSKVGDILKRIESSSGQESFRMRNLRLKPSR